MAGCKRPDGTGTARRRRLVASAVAALWLISTACGRDGVPGGPTASAAAPTSTTPTAFPSRSHPTATTPVPPPGGTVDPGTLPQTRAVPSDRSPGFRARMETLWLGIVTDSLHAAMPAFFPLSAYVQVKAIGDPAGDYRDRLVAAFRQDIHAAHDLLGPGAATAKLLRVSVPKQWTWIPPGGCYNDVGYWHAPGSRLVYEDGGQVRSFGVFSLISWRGQWYVVHLSSYDRPGTVDAPSSGRGAYGPPGGC